MTCARPAYILRPMIWLSRVACIVLVIVGGWVAALSGAALLLATLNELFGLGLWADGYSALGSASFAAFALDLGVLGLAGLGAGAAAFLLAARSAPRAASPGSVI